MMKWVLLAAVVALVWLWGTRYRRQGAGAPPRHPVMQPPAPTVTCLHCGVHVPVVEALAGHKGLYCCDNHCRAAGDRLVRSPPAAD